MLETEESLRVIGVSRGLIESDTEEERLRILADGLALIREAFEE